MGYFLLLPLLLAHFFTLAPLNVWLHVTQVDESLGVSFFHFLIMLGYADMATEEGKTLTSLLPSTALSRGDSMSQLTRVMSSSHLVPAGQQVDGHEGALVKQGRGSDGLMGMFAVFLDTVCAPLIYSSFVPLPRERPHVSLSLPLSYPHLPSFLFISWVSVIL